MSPWFVLSELQPILFVSQNRLEIRLRRQIRREKRSARYAKEAPSKEADVQF
jgi:hypothetical protein